MTTTNERFDFAHVYDGLKDFQRATVSLVADRLYGADPVDRFLVADEVGLGKTLVARGVIAKTIEHHIRRGTPRIDVVYICSNGAIARQNIRKLNVLERNDFNLASRITLLPRILTDLQGNRINFVSFTPGTSFNLRSSEGIAEERVLLFHMLRDLWGTGIVRGKGARKAFAGWSGFERFSRHIDTWGRNNDYDRGLAEAFQRRLAEADRGAVAAGRPPFVDRFEELRDRLAYARKNTGRSLGETAYRRAAFVGELRELLAQVCVDALEPDLVILDEFQRFKQILGRETAEGELAHQLFSYEGAKVLLLSATPYKMYTLDEELGDEHYADFLATLSFLAGDRDAEAFAGVLRDYRRALFTLNEDDGAAAQAAKERIERSLRRVIARTERLAVTPNREGMLQEPIPRGLRLEGSDLRHYLSLQHMSDELDTGPVLEYWSSTPYALNFMDGYKLDLTLERVLSGGAANGELARGAAVDGMLLDWDDVERYRRVDPANARLRSLLADTVERGAWRLLWVPPTLPYYELGEPFNDADLDGFTKRLVFSAWKVVPKVIAALVSYEAERRMMTARGEGQVTNTPEARARIRGLLRFAKTQNRLTGMPVLALLYPSVVLARVGDPRALAADLGAHDQPVPQGVALRAVEDRLRRLLDPHLRAAPQDGPVDESWYWAAPILLDRDDNPDALASWLEDEDLAERFISREGDEHGGEDVNLSFAEHLEHARAFMDDELEPLGRPPEDLVEVVAELALAGPGVVTLRALQRLGDFEFGEEDWDMRDYSGYLAWGFRSLFNLPEVMYLLRAGAGGRHREDAYWRLVLGYCLDGCLQSVLDEYFHVLRESLGLGGEVGADLLEELTDTAREALTIRTVNYQVRDLDVSGDRVSLVPNPRRMRGGFALRFGDDRAEDEKGLARASHVRSAFNSPFRPFVLATTSIGQEGLDFHTYCHAVVHWNVPNNPVDLEQREGRVHRYKGHAVRKNVATGQRAHAFSPQLDPWTAMFDAASQGRGPEASDLVPYWVYTDAGNARIERHVPALPLSRDAQRLTQLKRSLVAYRLVFGQPRQEDLVAFLSDHLDPNQLGEALERLQIDLTPASVTDIEPYAFDRSELGASGVDGAGPSESDTTDRGALYVAFWSSFLERLHAEHPGWSSASTPRPRSWFRMPSPIKHTNYAAVFTRGRIRHELYIGGGSREENLAIFERLRDRREILEDAYGATLVFEQLPARRACRIAEYREGCEVTDVESHDDFIEWFFDAGIRLRAALRALGYN